MLARNRASLAALVALAVIGQACSGSSTSPSPSAVASSAVASSQGAASAAAPSVQASQAALAPGTVTYWSMFAEGEPLQTVLAKGITDFEAENPNIKVQVNWVGRDVLTAAQGAIAAGTPVDIVDQANSVITQALVANDLALPLNSYLDGPGYDGTGAWRDAFNAGTFDQVTGTDGKTYMIPRDDYIQAMFTNMASLTAAGVSPPTTGMTWGDFMSMLGKLKASGVSPIGLDADQTGYNNWWFEDLAARNAGVDALLAAVSDKSGASWKAPEFLTAAQQVQQLRDGGYFQKGYEGSLYPAAQVGWVNGKNAMMLMGSWLPSEMSLQTPAGFQGGMIAFPNVDGGKGNDVVNHWSNAYVVFKSSKVPDQTVRLLQYLMLPKVTSEIAKLGTPVTVKDVTPPPALASQYTILSSAKSVVLDDFGLYVTAPEYMSKVFGICDDPFITGKTSAPEFISCMQSKSASYWAAH
jgi:raffinose/stachyose/melibiose transport system substrate-binding protein